MCLGFAAMSLAAIKTLQSMAPASCIVELATMTPGAINSASTGREPTGRPMMSTRTATPAPPHNLEGPFFAGAGFPPASNQPSGGTDVAGSEASPSLRSREFQ